MGRRSDGNLARPSQELLVGSHLLADERVRLPAPCQGPPWRQGHLHHLLLMLIHIRHVWQKLKQKVGYWPWKDTHAGTYATPTQLTGKQCIHMGKHAYIHIHVCRRIHIILLLCLLLYLLVLYNVYIYICVYTSTCMCVCAQRVNRTGKDGRPCVRKGMSMAKLMAPACVSGNLCTERRLSTLSKLAHQFLKRLQLKSTVIACSSASSD